MSWALKTKKSAGVPVSASVYKLIQKANSARNAGQWSAAADYYAAAVDEDPTLFHIWMQLGHAYKESDQPDKAEVAYRHASDLKPDSSEPLLHLGHLFKIGGDPVAAARSYFDAGRRESTNVEAVNEFTRLVARISRLKQEEIADLLTVDLSEDEVRQDAQAQALATAQASLALLSEGLSAKYPDQAEVLRSAVAILDTIKRESVEEEGAEDKVTLVFDASDLIGYYVHARLPTGIQRVQIEAITSALGASDKTVKICCFTDGRDEWLEIPAGQFLNISQLSVKSGEREDSEWVTALNKLNLTLALAEPFEFPDGAYLINLGTSWWLHNYFLYVRHAKARHEIRYIPFVHDFIPIITPEHCVKNLTQDFISWAIGVFDHADYFLVNSEATKRDLLMVAGILGHEVRSENIVVIRLDADFRKPETSRLGREALAKWRLDEEPYVLLVSTIESRKGHVVAMDAWLELIRRRGARNLPRLLLVGKNGWLNGAVYDRLEKNDDLASRVTILSDLSDDELALLYRSSLFTIYPSFYEGWGLPITESLCYGKAVITADNSSLPEASGGFANIVKTGSPMDLADAVEKMSFDADYRMAIEARIAAEFQPRTWKDIAYQIDSELGALAAKDTDVSTYRPPLAKLGAYHPVTSNVGTRIWRGFGSGEVFRTGLGWLWPDSWGCWTLPQGGSLLIGLPDARPALRVYLLLKNYPGHDCPWRLRIKGLPTMTGTLARAEERWISFDYPVFEDGGTLGMNLRGEWSENISLHGREYLVSIGLRGFFICAADDAVARSAFLEAASLGNVTDLDAYREPIVPKIEIDHEDWDFE